MSGSSLVPGTISTDPEFFTQSLAKSLNCEVPSVTNSSPESDQSAQKTSSSSLPVTTSSSTQIIECLRTKSMEEILKVTFDGYEDDQQNFLMKTSFGPVIDGLLIPADPRILMQQQDYDDYSHLMISPHMNYAQTMSSSGHKQQFRTSSSQSLLSSMTSSSSPFRMIHPLLTGVTRIESPFIFTDSEEKMGIEGNRRDQIMSSFIKNYIDYYQEVSLDILLSRAT